MTRRIVFASLYSLLIAAPAFAQPAPATPTPATSPADPGGPADATPPPSSMQPAPVPTSDVVPNSQPPTPPSMQAPEPKPETKKETSYIATKWDAQLYGFVEADTIYDSVQGGVGSINDSLGNAAIPRPNTYAGDHGQLTYGARNSRIGFRLGAPTYEGIKATAQLEMDFLGNQPTTVSEAQFWNNPAMRFRHLNVKLESKYFDVLIGQYWELFGWQSNFHPNTVEIQGVPGQVYSRTPQIRISKTIKSDAIQVDLAIAALRSPQRDSATPDGQAGIKISLPKWKGWHTAGATGSAYDMGAIGVSGVGRRFAVDEFAANPHSQVVKYGGGVSIDAFLPLYGGTKENHANALAVTASYVKGTGTADLYTGLSGGVSNAALPTPTGATTPPVYTPNIDSGLAMFTADGTLHTVNWQSYIVGAQYYLPPSGRVWLSANYSRINSDNAAQLGAATKVWTKESWGDVNLFVDVTPAVRLGLEGALYDMTYADETTAKDYRVQFSGFFIF